MKTDTSIKRQLNELVAFHRGLTYERYGEIWKVRGELSFLCEDVRGRDIKDYYNVEIHVPEKFPNQLPSVFEVGGKIDKIADNHVFTDTGALCLGTRVACLMSAIKSKTLLNFVNGQIVPYLVGYSYFLKYEVWPYGELSHDDKGIVEYYRDYFATNNDELVLKLIRLATFEGGKLQGKSTHCICASGKNFGDCHYESVRLLSKPALKDELKRDLIHCTRHMNKKPVLRPISELTQKMIFNNEDL